MLYKKSKSKELDKELFKNPSSEYRGAPFWAWNCELDKEVLLEQIEFLKKMGFGGFHIHSRAGMATEYLSEDFFELVKACVDKAKNENMLAYLYDEDRWPSGSAGGYVTKNKRYRARSVELTQKPEAAVDEQTGIETGNTYLFACYDINVAEDGTLKSYRLIDEADDAEHSKWYAYIKTAEDNPWYNGAAYSDTLSKEAIDRFIKITHESYKEHVGNDFSKTVPTIFTDEPQYIYKQPIERACSNEAVVYPWTPLLPEEYLKKYKEELKTSLPEVFWDLPDGKPSRTRYRYIDLTCELFVSWYNVIDSSNCHLHYTFLLSINLLIRG